MKVYTKKGDQGETGLLGGSRISKSHSRVEAYGVVDELNALLGLVRTEPVPELIDGVLERLQRELFVLGTGLAAADPKRQTPDRISDTHVSRIEDEIDRFANELPPLRHFILPGGTRAGAMLHVARAACRRAERRVVALRDSQHEHVPDHTIPYLNRLGDLLFILARAANANQGVPDVIWRKQGE